MKKIQPDPNELPATCSWARRLCCPSAFKWCYHLSGFPYVALTLFFSVRFLLTSETILSNDLFLHDFNVSHGATFMANVFNQVLPNRNHLRFQLSNAEFAVFDPNGAASSGSSPMITFSSGYVRTLVYHHLNTLPHAVRGIRLDQSGGFIFYHQTQFCWVDLNRTFSLAHTAKREQRCLASQTTNGAVYLETYLRNFNASSANSLIITTMYDQNLVQPLQESPQGRDFWHSILDLWNRSNPDFLFSADQEVAYWQSKGITHFTLQWGNYLTPSLTEQIELIPAMGGTANLTIKVCLAAGAPMTTQKMYWSFFYDYMLQDWSLIRGTSRFYETMGLTMEQLITQQNLSINPVLPWPYPDRSDSASSVGSFWLHRLEPTAVS